MIICNQKSLLRARREEKVKEKKRNKEFDIKATN
jgi:hypothetical protein